MFKTNGNAYTELWVWNMDSELLW